MKLYDFRGAKISHIESVCHFFNSAVNEFLCDRPVRKPCSRQVFFSFKVVRAVSWPIISRWVSWTFETVSCCIWRRNGGGGGVARFFGWKVASTMRKVGQLSQRDSKSFEKIAQNAAQIIALLRRTHLLASSYNALKTSRASGGISRKLATQHGGTCLDSSAYCDSVLLSFPSCTANCLPTPERRSWGEGADMWYAPKSPKCGRGGAPLAVQRWAVGTDYRVQSNCIRCHVLLSAVLSLNATDFSDAQFRLF